MVRLSINGKTHNVDVDPKGRFAYSGECLGSNVIHAYAIDKKTAGLTAVPGSPFPVDIDVCGGTAITKKGLIAFGLADPVLQVFTRSKTGALEAPLTPVVAPGADSHALSSNQKTLVMADDDADMVVTWAFNPKTGDTAPIDAAGIPGASGASDTLIVKR